MKIFQGEKQVIKSWCENPESGAIDQAKNVAKLSFLSGPVILLPDTHFGYGVPIGSVFGTKDVIIPNAVGKDIGCGMCAVKTSLTEIDKNTLKKIMGEIRKIIPLGKNHQKEMQDKNLMPQINGIDINELPEYGNSIIRQQYSSARTQLGTLGSGNHFIEIQKGSDGFIWIMIHSGSRNLGSQIADFYNKQAKELNQKWHTGENISNDLAYLPIESNEGQFYLKEMNYAVNFALANRKLMMNKIIEIFIDQIKPFNNWTVDFYGVDMINIAHNYASLENHNGKNVWIHRKGATLAREDTIGIIPGSQGSCSYIVKGKGNNESYNSCSHGAGRKMGREAAKRNLNLEDEKKILDDKGVIHGIRNIGDLDEATGAYKNIDIVMDEQKDLVDILVKLEPLAVIKG